MFKISLPTAARHCLALVVLMGVALSSSAFTVKDPLGSAVAESANARVIKITAATKTINVERYETVRFVNPAGQSFTWSFHTLHHPVINVSEIAPAGFTDVKAMIYVGLGASEYH